MYVVQDLSSREEAGEVGTAEEEGDQARVRAELEMRLTTARSVGRSGWSPDTVDETALMCLEVVSGGARVGQTWVDEPVDDGRSQRPATGQARVPSSLFPPSTATERGRLSDQSHLVSLSTHPIVYRHLADGSCVGVVRLGCCDELQPVSPGDARPDPPHAFA